VVPYVNLFDGWYYHAGVAIEYAPLHDADRSALRETPVLGACFLPPLNLTRQPYPCRHD
jgi:hypothetical protein